MLKLLGVAVAMLAVACGSADTKPEVEVVVVNGSTVAATSSGSGGADAGGCTSNADCKNGEACVEMACEPLLTNGEYCSANAAPCALGLYCAGFDKKCTAQLTTGDACINDAQCLNGKCINPPNNGVATCN